MPPQHRVFDMGKVDSDAHGCPACPHPAVGPAVQGSPNVNVNGLPATRETDIGVHGACCGPNMWTAKGKSGTVKINSKGAHRKDDAQTHCGGNGKSIQGSPNVNTGG